jgi:hypothetical protein
LLQETTGMTGLTSVALATSVASMQIAGTIGTGLNIGALITTITGNLSTSRRRCTTSHGNLPALISFSRSIFVGNGVPFAPQVQGKLSPAVLGL